MHRLVWCTLIIWRHTCHLRCWNRIAIIVDLRRRGRHSGSCSTIAVTIVVALRRRSACLIVLILSWLLRLAIVHTVLLLKTSIIASIVPSGTASLTAFSSRLALLSCIPKSDLSR